MTVVNSLHVDENLDKGRERGKRKEERRKGKGKGREREVGQASLLKILESNFVYIKIKKMKKKTKKKKRKRGREKKLRRNIKKWSELAAMLKSIAVPVMLGANGSIFGRVVDIAFLVEAHYRAIISLVELFRRWV